MAETSLLRDALVYLAAAVVCVPLVKRAGLGSVLGYLVAGCAIGPWGLGFVSNVQSMLQFSEFGVVLMLFLIGLELDVRRLVEMRGPVFGGGALQMVACGAALALLLWAAGLAWPGAVVGGLALAMSSTAIALQTMTERNLLGAPLGRSAFAVLLFQDIAAIPLIALVPLLGGGIEGGESGWQLALKGLAAILIVIVIGRFLTQPVMRLIARSGVREIFTAFALLLVLGIAELMSLADLSMALGAFLAGVLLASSEFRHALETDIAPFKGLLLGLFFIAVGMSIDFGLVGSRPWQLALLVTGLLGVKTVLLALIAGKLELQRERWLFAALLAQAGEFAFVVFGVARQARVLPAEWEALLTAAVALSMAATPLLLLAYDTVLARRVRSTRAADTIDDDSAPVIVAGAGRYGQIVARLLYAHGVSVTVLDHDPDQIDPARLGPFGSEAISSGAASRHATDTDVLDHQVFVDAVLRALASEARLLHAAERCDLVRDQAGIDADHAALEALGDAKHARDVARVEIGRKAELGRVGQRHGLVFGREAEHRGDRAESLLARDQHVARSRRPARSAGRTCRRVRAARRR